MDAILEAIHGRHVHGRRVRVLSDHLGDLLPEGATVIDVGCGDGLIGALVQQRRPDVSVTGFDVGVRSAVHITVNEFDGHRIPVADDGAEAVMLVDVMHHADDPIALLREAARVADRAILLKDVMTLGPLSEPTLQAMDWVGNARHGVPLPYNFWSQAQWREAFAELGLGVDAVRRRLGLYPRPWHLLFERRMHFVVRLSPGRASWHARG